MPPDEREWFSWTKGPSTPCSAQRSSRNDSRRKPRSSPCAVASSRTRSGISVSIRVTLTKAWFRTGARSTRGTRPSGSAPTTPRSTRYQSTTRAMPSSKPTCAFQPRALRLLRAERVAPVVARTVLDVFDQRLVAIAPLQDLLDDVDVRPLVGPADVVGLAGIARARGRCRSPRRSPRPRASCAPAARRHRRAADRRRARSGCRGGSASRGAGAGRSCSRRARSGTRCRRCADRRRPGDRRRPSTPSTATTGRAARTR